MATLRLLLLQARLPDDPTRDGEVADFARRAGLPAESFSPWDLLAGAPSVAEARRFDGLMIGGSGDFYVSKGDLPEQRAFLDFLADWVEQGVPTFGACYGFQSLVQALGGEVSHDPGSTEVGTYELELTEEGREDPLFGTMPERFDAQLGRKDRAVRLPAGVPNLARSERCPFQGLRIPDRPVWASQFHPELDERSNRERFLRYLDGYATAGGAAMTPEEQQQQLDAFRQSPHASDLLRRFVDLVFE
ncbi:MAG: type 1 glutamine amidotransferase [Thermoanaerobaculia bacterium]|nr:type 1 glutamine amidotransferase [Thermoanaerobaculia bacterium]